MACTCPCPQETLTKHGVLFTKVHQRLELVQKELTANHGGRYHHEEIWKKLVIHLQQNNNQNGTCSATLAFLYKHGIGVEQNKSVAQEYVAKAAAQGYIGCSLLIAFDEQWSINEREVHFEKAIDHPQNVSLAHWISLADIMYCIANFFYQESICIYNEKSVKEDAEHHAIMWLVTCGDKCPKALLRLADLHWRKTNYHISCRYALQAARQGYNKACLFLFNKYQIAREDKLLKAINTGMFSSNKMEEKPMIITSAIVIALLHSAAARDHDPSCVALGQYYFKDGDYETAVYWYEVAAKKGNARALFHLAQCYRYGYVYARNMNVAWEYYNKIAHSDHFAAFEVAKIYFDGLRFQVPTTDDTGLKGNEELTAASTTLLGAVEKLKETITIAQKSTTMVTSESEASKVKMTAQKDEKHGKVYKEIIINPDPSFAFGMLLDILNYAPRQEETVDFRRLIEHTLCEVGCCYMYGKGVDVNISKSIEYFEKAINKFKSAMASKFLADFHRLKYEDHFEKFQKYNKHLANERESI